MCTTVEFDVLAHLTYCLRYMKQRDGIEPDISRFDELIAESFRALIEKGRGIEINTSGIRQGFGDCFPDLKYARLFRDLGGEILSIGSDAHRVEDIGSDIEKGIEPVYEELPGWKTDLSQLTDESQFPLPFKQYIDFLEKELETPIRIISIGPDRQQTIIRK